MPSTSILMWLGKASKKFTVSSILFRARQGDRPRPCSIRCESTDIFGRHVRLGGPISFCYIDGNHSYAFAKRDFQNCDEFLEQAGFILFDDSADDSQFEVKQVIEEIKASGEYEVVVKNPDYLLRKL